MLWGLRASRRDICSRVSTALTPLLSADSTTTALTCQHHRRCDSVIVRRLEQYQEPGGFAAIWSSATINFTMYACVLFHATHVKLSSGRSERPIVWCLFTANKAGGLRRYKRIHSNTERRTRIIFFSLAKSEILFMFSFLQVKQK